MSTSPSVGVCPHTGPPARASLAEQACHLYQCQQLSTYRVAQLLGIDRQRVTRMLHAAGVPVKARGAGRTRPPDVRGELVADLYQRCRLSSTQIARLTGVPARTVTQWLHARGVPVRTRGRMRREDRLSVPLPSLIELYVRGGLSASETGQLLGVSLRVVLRAAHDLGLPVRIGGPPGRHGPADIRLVDALYGDRLVCDALARHGVAAVPPGGAIWERFPARVPVTGDLVTELYVGCGLGLRQIELLTGAPAETVRQMLARHGVPLRGQGGRSPFLRRWRRERAARSRAEGGS
ncbi:MAG TPA: hypothetical protein VFV41_15070 [Streptosporangiaceae bacterium]|nr:hypothetical protein [Streptosporangiaceae bacterium]